MTVENIEDSMDILRIMDLIPHRYPMLLIDRVEKIRGNEGAVGIKNVTMNEWFFQGHFPSRPIFPGVLIVEAMAQTAGVVVVNSLGTEAQRKLVYFMSIDEVRFRKPVLPGHCLELHIQKDRARGNVWRYRGEAKVGDMLMAEATFTAMITDEK